MVWHTEDDRVSLLKTAYHLIWFIASFRIVMVLYGLEHYSDYTDTMATNLSPIGMIPAIRIPFPMMLSCQFMKIEKDTCGLARKAAV